MELYNLVSFMGIFVIAGFAWLCSNNRKVVNWRVIIWGIGLQLLFAFFIFVLPIGAKFFLFVNDIVVTILESATEGTKFVFGRLALPPGTTNADGETSLGHFLAFQGLPTVIFFAALVSALYYLRIMPLIIRGFASVFTKLMRISGAESLCASSNIFVGVESALVVKPHLKDMTKSELTTILAAGMGTIASTVLAIYVFFLQDQMPMIAGHLVSASVLSAPAAVVMAKLIFPEVEEPKTLGLDVKPHYEREDNLIMAIINGANTGLKYLFGIVALLIAFLGILALLDVILGWFGGNLNGWFGWSIVATEVASYKDLSQLLAQGTLQHPRSAIIASYALCGFAQVASLAIFVGGIGALAPQRMKDLSRLGFRALLAATLACLMTGAVAGVFYTSSSILLNR
jgi:CNT family concentrative nucleoside transporter